METGEEEDAPIRNLFKRSNILFDHFNLGAVSTYVWTLLDPFGEKSGKYFEMG